MASLVFAGPPRTFATRPQCPFPIWHLLDSLTRSDQRVSTLLGRAAMSFYTARTWRFGGPEVLKLEEVATQMASKK